jgi:hypothetical protein
MAVIAGRLFVAGVFLVYGLIKLAGEQFVPGEFQFDSRSDSMVTLVWHFYGYSPVYHRFVGLAEVAPAVLLLWPRTAALGALVALPVAANIAVMDWCFGFPASATGLITEVAVVSAALLWADRARVMALCGPDAAGGAAERAEPSYGLSDLSKNKADGPERR